MDRKTTLLITLLATGGCFAQQRYLNEVFTRAQVLETPDVNYGTNIDFMTSDLSDPNVFIPQAMQLQAWVSAQQPIPAAFYDPTDNSTALKVTDLRMDIYQPDPSIDCTTQRPLAIYLHAGDCLPPGINGVPYGDRKDSSAVEICRQLARRGYVAVSVGYRGGWNPLAASVLELRSGLINAVYRAVHDGRQAVRTLKADATTYGIDPDEVLVLGEGVGGFVALSMATLDDPAELYIEKFRTDPFDPNSSMIDTTVVGNLEGLNGLLTLYRPNGYASDIHFVANLGGALPDSSWLEPGDVPMVSFHTVFNPYTPFGTGVVYAPGGVPIVEVTGSNDLTALVDQFGNNASFANLPSDTWSGVARARYGTTLVHTGASVQVGSAVEGLFPIVTADWPALSPGAMEAGNPWAWWDPASPYAANGLYGNPAASAAFGHAMIDTLMGYLNPRMILAFSPDTCTTPVGMAEASPVHANVALFPNPATTQLTVTSSEADMLGYALYDVNGRSVRTGNVNNRRFTLERKDLPAGAYFLRVTFEDGNVVRRVLLD